MAGAKNRPLAPHLSVWKPGPAMIVSILHRISGDGLALLGLPVAWARIYLGVHFPMDMVGAASVAALSAWLCLREERWLLGPVFQCFSAAYRRIFGPLIRRGWVLK